MKLHSISESFLSVKMRDAIMSQDMNTTDNLPPSPTTGFDELTTEPEGTQQPTGIPKDVRHRSFFGLSTRPGTLRL